MGSVRGPSQVVYLSTAGPAHVLGTPGLFVVEALGTKVGRGHFARYPENHVSIVAGGCKEFTYEGTRKVSGSLNRVIVAGRLAPARKELPTFGCPSYDIDGLVVLG